MSPKDGLQSENSRFRKRAPLLLAWVVLCVTSCLPTGGGTRLGPPTTAPSATTTGTAGHVSAATGRGAGDTLTILYWQAPTVLNPHLAQGAKDRAASRITYEPLASYDRDGYLIPFLAAEIPTLENGGVAADGKSVTWKLKSDLFWSDGQPFTARDVLFTYEFATDPAISATTASAYSAIQSVEALDNTTVQIRFKDINPAWSQPFVGLMGMILPEHAFAGYSDPLQAPVNNLPIGTGPYRAISFKPQEVLFLGNELIETNKLVFEPNPYFRDPDKPYFSEVIVKGGGTATEAARLVFEAGDVDFTHNLDMMDAQVLADLQDNSSKGRLISQFGGYVERIALNRADPKRVTEDGERASIRYPHPFFNDLRVRQAFSLAVDREAIAGLYGPGGRATSNLLVSPQMYASPNTRYEYNLTKAARLLDEAGWVDSNDDGIRERVGVRLSVTYQSPVSVQRQQIQEIVRIALESIGVEVKLKIIDSSIFFGNDPDNPGTRLHFYADMEQFAASNLVPDPGAYMKSWTCAEMAQKANSWTGRNAERWCNPAYDALYAQAAREIDPERRRQLFIEMNDMLVEDVVAIPIGHRGEVFGVSNNLEGVNLTPWDAETWSIQDWKRVSP